MPSRNLLTPSSSECCSTYEDEQAQPAKSLRWSVTEPILDTSTSSSPRVSDEYGLSRQSSTSSSSYEVQRVDSIHRPNSSSRRAWHGKRYSWSILSSKRSNSAPPSPSLGQCTVQHQYYCPRRLEARHYFYDRKVATRLAHIRDIGKSSRGARSGGAIDAAGDLNDLRQERQHWRSECDCCFEELKEPDAAYEITTDILSVMDL